MPDPTKNPTKGGMGCFWYLIPVILILGGIVLPFIPAIQRYRQPTFRAEFLAPGTLEVQLTNSGTYTLWFDHRATFQGRIYSSGPDLPYGLEVTLKNKATGENLPMTTAMNSRVTVGDSARRSVGSFEILAPGRYELSISGAMAQPGVFSFRQNWFLDALSQTLVYGIAGIGAVVAGIVALIVIFIWRRRA